MLMFGLQYESKVDQGFILVSQIHCICMSTPFSLLSLILLLCLPFSTLSLPLNRPMLPP